jgi:predicted methyltransferase
MHEAFIREIGLADWQVAKLRELSTASDPDQGPGSFDAIMRAFRKYLTPEQDRRAQEYLKATSERRPRGTPLEEKSTPRVSGPSSVPPPLTLRIDSVRPLANIGTNYSGMEEEGTVFAKAVRRALEQKDPGSLRIALAAYSALHIPESNTGAYSALRWMCAYLLDPEQRRRNLDEWSLSYIDYLAKDGFAVLTEYINRQFDLKQYNGENAKKAYQHLEWLNDFVIDNSPERRDWERPDLVMERSGIRAGDTVADIGSGAGYYTFRLSARVGPQGKVYAIDTKPEHVAYAGTYAKEHGRANVIPVCSQKQGFSIPDTVDAAFMSGVYHTVYVALPNRLQRNLLRTIRDSVKSNGKLVVLDSGPPPPNAIPAGGAYVAKELVIHQLAYYGFALVSSTQITAQKYLLVFEKREWNARGEVRP